jgi:hypothetical protein
METSKHRVMFTFVALGCAYSNEMEENENENDVVGDIHSYFMQMILHRN